MNKYHHSKHKPQKWSKRNKSNHCSVTSITDLCVSTMFEANMMSLDVPLRWWIIAMSHKPPATRRQWTGPRHHPADPQGRRTWGQIHVPDSSQVEGQEGRTPARGSLTEGQVVVGDRAWATAEHEQNPQTQDKEPARHQRGQRPGRPSSPREITSHTQHWGQSTSTREDSTEE